MVLRMARPVKHPKTGIYQFRKRVPDALRSLIGKREEKISLGTRDPAEAKIQHARVSAEVEARWRQLAEGTQSLSTKQAEAIAGEIYHSMITQYEDNPDQIPGRLGSLLLDRHFQKSRPVRLHVLGANPDLTNAMLKKLEQHRNDKAIEDWLFRHGLILDPDSHVKVRAAVDRSILQAREQLGRMASGDYRPDPNANRFPPAEVIRPKRKKASGANSPTAIFDAYTKENALKPATVKRWRPIFLAIEKEAPDVAEITREWILKWKDDLVAKGLANKSIRDVHLASTRAVFGWAAMNGRMSVNPVDGIKIKVPRKSKTRSQGFTDDEVAKILSATFLPSPDRLSPHHALARRWVPWLCAFTGARVGEIAQLRKEDVQEKDGIWLLWITPEAGTTKDNKARFVALHQTLIDQGFLEVIEKRGYGPLFYPAKRPRGGTAQNPPAEAVGQHLAKWVRRDIKITDRSIRPNHAWRHRFKTLARNLGMRESTETYMLGHAPATAGEAYGDFQPPALLREISKLPPIMLSNV